MLIREYYLLAVAADVAQRVDTYLQKLQIVFGLPRPQGGKGALVVSLILWCLWHHVLRPCPTKAMRTPGCHRTCVTCAWIIRLENALLSICCCLYVCDN